VKRFFQIAGNKYLITLAIFLVLMLFFDRNDFFSQLERKKELHELEAGAAFYRQEIDKTNKQLVELKNNPNALEKFCREQLLMKKEGEDLFITETPPTAARRP
jgi:cell division protein DivIC